MEYDRELFPHWDDPDGDGFDARQQAIWKQVVQFDGIKLGEVENGIVVRGLYHDPYTGQNYDIKENNPDVDHLIPLKLAWDRGADTWTTEKRKQFANDPLNLVAVHLSSNRQKSAKSIYDWMPPNLNYAASYLIDLSILVRKYELIPTEADLKAFEIVTIEAKRLHMGIKLDFYLDWLAERGVTFS